MTKFEIPNYVEGCFSRDNIPEDIKLHVTAAPNISPDVYGSKDEFVSNACRSEANLFNTSGTNAIRKNFGLDPDLEVFCDNDTVPIFTVAIFLSGEVFGNPILRNKYELAHMSGSKTTKSSYATYKNIRGTSSSHLRIELANFEEDAPLHFSQFKGTIFDRTQLMNDVSLFNKAVSIIDGYGWSDAYGVETVDFKPLPLHTNMCTSSAITYVSDDSSVKLSIFGFNTIKSTDGKVDPTFVEAMIAFTYGFRIYRDNELILPEEIPQTFNTNLYSKNIFYVILSFFYNLPTGYINPGFNYKSKKDTNSISMLSVSSQKNGKEHESSLPLNNLENSSYKEKEAPSRLPENDDLKELISFCNNLYSVNHGWFYSFVRKNKLFNMMFRGKISFN